MSNNQAPTIPGLEDLRARMEDMKATAYERLQALPFADKLPGIIFKPPSEGTETIMTRILAKRPKLLGQKGGILKQHTASQLPAFNFPGIASVLLPQRGKRMHGRTHKQVKVGGMHPGIVDTTRSAVERAKGAFPVSRNIAVEL
jgi:hypothetical protein